MEWTEFSFAQLQLGFKAQSENVLNEFSKQVVYGNGVRSKFLIYFNYGVFKN